MSDDDRDYSEEEEEEEEEDERSKRGRGRDTESQHRSKTPHIDESQQKSEAELMMEEKLRKKKDDEEEGWREYIENWRKQRAKEEDDLKRLKDKVAKRKTLRLEEEKKMAEQKKGMDEARAKEFEEKRTKEQEEKRRRLEEAEKRRQAMLRQQKDPTAEGKLPNFVINKREGGGPGVTMVGDKVIPKTKEQLAEEKKIALSFRIKALEIDGLDKEALKDKTKELWEAIIKLETEKYDLEERQKRQEYDLKELSERQRQINRNKALKKGLDAEALSGKHPPKIQTSSKYERRIDRRTYGDKKGFFNGGYESSVVQFQESTWTMSLQTHKEKKGKLPKWLGEQPGKKPGDPDEEEEVPVKEVESEETHQSKHYEEEEEEEEEEDEEE